MALVTRILTNVGDSFCKADGTPLVGIVVTFTLVDSVKKKRLSTFDKISGELYSGENVDVVLDANGEFSTPIWVNSRSEIPSLYKVSFSGNVVKPFYINVLDSLGVCSLAEARAATTEVVEQTDLDALAVLLSQIQNEVSTISEVVASAIADHDGGVVHKSSDETITGFKRFYGGVDFSETAQEPFELIAHRGFDALAPENTLTSFSVAYALGCTSWEFDLQVTSDGVVVVIHDTGVERTTNGVGNIKDLSSAYVLGLDAGSYFGSSIFASSRIPTFAELLTFAKGKAKKLYPEIKDYRTQADIALMVQQVVDAGMEDVCVFQAFNLADLQYLRTLNTRIAVSYLGTNIVGLSQVRQLSGKVFYSLDYTQLLANPSWVGTLRAADVGVSAWTLSTKRDVQALGAIGVSKVICSNYAYGAGNANGSSLSVDPKWVGGWIDIVSGAGANSVDAYGVYRANDPDAASAAKKEIHFWGAAGDVVEIEVFARAATGVGHIYIDCDASGSTLDQVTVNSTDFRLYTLRAVIPWFKGSGPQLRVGFGCYTAETGNDAYFYAPRIRTTSGRVGLSTLACGLISVPQGGNPLLVSSYTNKGVTSVAKDTDNSTLVVTLANNALLDSKPVLFANGSLDNPKVVLPGNFVDGGCTFKIGVRNFDGSLFTYNSGGTFYCFFKVER